MTPQEFFDKSVRGVIDQGRKSEVLHTNQFGATFGRCLYRGPGNCKCAVGHCIPDNEYKPEWDSGNGYGACGVGRNLGWSEDVIKLACCLQDAHDSAGANFIDDFKRKAMDTAKYFGLDPTELTR